MNCIDAEKLFSEYIEGSLEAGQQAQFEQHLSECAGCRRQLAAERGLHQALSTVGEAELPEGFKQRVHQALMAEAAERQRKPAAKRAWVRIMATAAACLVLLFGASALLGRVGSDTPAAEPQAADYAASVETYDMATDEEMAIEEPVMEAEMGDGALTGANDSRMANATASMERKIIKNAYISLEVDDLNNAYQTIEQMAVNYGGYVVSGNRWKDSDGVYRNGYIEIRVDAEALTAAVGELGELGSLDSEEYSSSDVTMEYYDIAGRLEQYQSQLTRLNELYAQATVLSEILEIESKINEVNINIDSLQGMINYYDQMTSLSLISINLYTPRQYTQTLDPQGFEGLWQDAKEGFISGLNAFCDFIAWIVVGIVSLLPFLLLIAIAVVVIAAIVRRRRKRKAERA
ncbi:MAG: DUF4349 domain-containing protein [Bacillota bacterium]|nr:DUF4349 domain-containing protein [Bacillota bacterium]